MNFTEYWRTNYFQVDPEKRGEFDKWLESIGLDVMAEKDGLIALGSDEGEGFPSEKMAGEEDPADCHFLDEIEEFLAVGTVLIITSCGREGMRALSGYSLARYKKAEGVMFRKNIHIGDIYDYVRKSWKVEDFTPAEY